MKNLKIVLALVLFIFGCSPQKPNIQKEWAKMHRSKSNSIEKFNDNKLGMFIHFGVFSNLAGYWKGKKIPGIGECIMRYAEIPRAAYREAAAQFNPAQFNAEEWVKAAKMAGMRYIVAMPKHADGFAMYDSKVTDWDIMDVTQFHRDPMQELYEACKKYDINFSIYFNYLDWMDGGNGGVNDYAKTHPNEDTSYRYWANTWDPSPVSFKDYFENKYKPQLRELLHKFPGIQELWHDMPMKLTTEQSFDIYKLVYDIQPTALDNSRIGNDFGDFWIPGDNIIPEGEKVYEHNGTIDKLDKVEDLPWETPGTMNNTWGYRKDDSSWKSTPELLYWLTSITSKGGNYLLNIGPTGEGLFPEESLKRLKDIGDWMKVNGESFYGSKKWIVNQEGPTKIAMTGTNEREKKGFNTNFTSQDFWFSKKDNHLYITSLKWPETNNILVQSLTRLSGDNNKNISSVDLLGYDKTLSWSMNDKGIKVTLPTARPNPFGYVLKVTLKK
jgi:alpha-L-fucosidase